MVMNVMMMMMIEYYDYHFTIFDFDYGRSCASCVLFVLLLLAFMTRTRDYYDDMLGLPVSTWLSMNVRCHCNILHCFLLSGSGSNVVELVLTIKIHYRFVISFHCSCFVSTVGNVSMSMWFAICQCCLLWLLWLW